MATVTRKFRDDFDTWAADRIRRGEFTPVDMEDFKEMLRRDLAPGPDQLRAGYTVIVAAGVEIPAAIDDHEQRYQLWADYFAVEAEAIRRLGQKAA
jgi:hypothetical protein